MKIVILGGKSESTLFVYNSLKKIIPIECVFIEKKPSSIQLLGSRIKKFGLLKVINQIIFQTIIIYFLKISSRSRVKEIINEFKLDNSDIATDKLIHVESVNSTECLNLLQKIKPELIIVNGTRIITKNILNSISCLFINTHAGITPEYRGVHGAYWALVNNDIENCGVTVHKVDTGIDTGDLIKQGKIRVTSKDNFVTYPYLQYGLGIQLLKDTIREIQSHNLSFYKKENVNSQLFSHPSFTQYIYNYYKMDVK